jgi:hypothetical protein
MFSSFAADVNASAAPAAEQGSVHLVKGYERV